MRILILSQFYPPIIGGEERHVHNLSIALATRGHDVSVATLWQEGITEFEDHQGVHIYRVHASMQRVTSLFTDKGRQHSPPFPDPEVLWALRRIIKRERPDIIHAHNWMVHSFIPLKQWSKAKLVLTLHDCSLVCAKKRFMYQDTLCDGPKSLKCLNCASNHYGLAKGVPTALANTISGMAERKLVDMFLPVSQAIAEATRLTKHRVSYQVIPNFIPNNVDIVCDKAHPLLAQLPEEDFLLFVGDIVPDKGVEILFQAYSEIESRVPLVLIGRRGPNLSACPPNVRILENWPHAAIMGAWSRCTIALMPSICLDACPTVTMEAMAMGRPVVASRIGGLSDLVIDGETGLLVTSGSPQELRNAIQCLLDDPIGRERIGNMAKQRVVAFQAKSVVSRIEQVYHEVLGL